MSSPEDQGPSARSNFLPVMLTAMLAMFGLLVLIVLTSGFVLYVGGWVLAFIALGSVHYLLWGRAFEQQTAGEREEAEWRERVEHDRKRTDVRTFDR
jgi:hypothetical protein